MTTRRLVALVGYRAELLLRSYRWLPPVLLYALILTVGIQPGQPLMDSLGYAGAATVPAAAWLIRGTITAEPAAARACVGASAGPGWGHLAGVLAALAAGVVMAGAGTAVIAAISGPVGGGAETERAAAVLAGVMTQLVCVLVGTVVGALCSPPLLRHTGYAIPLTGMGAILALVVGISPANAAITTMVSSAEAGAVRLPWGGLATGLLLVAGVTWLTCAAARRRSYE
ncbi:ABC transporter [Allostreptomyces psammosilenae]|uniref:ABC transporter n=1 Tax=Allostreptomyces psammosilenae TaxID=1892865 RepID=A0A852ZQX3_9ACTN|nr:ABC transporter [Allostreptomyces psammosilenae]NYI03254.1 hypothetical protein [Allostreptomyces psammosilenae]